MRMARLINSNLAYIDVNGALGTLPLRSPLSKEIVTLGFSIHHLRMALLLEEFGKLCSYHLCGSALP